MKNYHRWNFELGDDELLVCRNDHDKGDKCHYESLTLDETLEIINQLRSTIIELEARLKSIETASLVSYRTSS